jgi:hypothetical protein
MSQEQSSTSGHSRRRFLGTAIATATAASYGRILGANDRIQVGAIGTGHRCQYLLSVLNKVGGNDIVAVCDVYEPHRLEAKAKYGPSAKDYVHFQDVLDRKDIDAVVIGTPDHWHVPVTVAAVGAGKDVYCEKPITHRLEESETLITAVRQSKRVFQSGMQQRSWKHYMQAHDLMASGRLGQVTLIRTYWYQNYVKNQDSDPAIDQSKLDWKLFLGAVPYRPFDEDQYAYWRWYWDRTLGGCGAVVYGSGHAQTCDSDGRNSDLKTAAGPRYDERRTCLPGNRCRVRLRAAWLSRRRRLDVPWNQGGNAPTSQWILDL